MRPMPQEMIFANLCPPFPHCFQTNDYPVTARPELGIAVYAVGRNRLLIEMIARPGLAFTREIGVGVDLEGIGPGPWLKRSFSVLVRRSELFLIHCWDSPLKLGPGDHLK